MVIQRGYLWGGGTNDWRPSVNRAAIGPARDDVGRGHDC